MPTYPCPLPKIEIKRPLLSVNTVMAALDRDGIAVVELIENGKLPWAFNVGRSAAKREIRVLAHCVSAFQCSDFSQCRAMDFSTVIGLIFPMAARAAVTLKATTVARRFNLKIESVTKLLDSGCLRGTSSTVQKCGGPDGSPEIEFASVVEFLQARRIL